MLECSQTHQATSLDFHHRLMLPVSGWLCYAMLCVSVCDCPKVLARDSVAEMGRFGSKLSSQKIDLGREMEAETLNVAVGVRRRVADPCKMKMHSFKCMEDSNMFAWWRLMHVCDQMKLRVHIFMHM